MTSVENEHGTAPIIVTEGGGAEVAWARLILEQEPEIRQIATFETFRFVALAILAFPAPVALVTMLTRHLDIGWWPMNVIITAAFYIPICFAIISRLPWNQTLYKLTLSSYRATKPQCNPMTLTIDASGVTLESDQSRSLYKWSMFERVVRFGKSGIGIQFASALNGVAVSINAFADEAHAEAFAARATELLAASGQDTASRIRPQLKETKLNCSCGQSLQGLEHRRCPECGRQFSTLTLTTLAILQKPFLRRLLHLGSIRS